MLGNAVAVPVAEWLAWRIRYALEPAQQSPGALTVAVESQELPNWKVCARCLKAETET